MMSTSVSTGLSRTINIFDRMLLPKVRNLTIRNFFTLDVGAPLIDVIQFLMKDDMPSVIITKEGNPVGIITRNDMLSRLFFQKVNIEETTAGDIMASPLITIDFNQNVLDAYELMMQKGINGLIVLKDGKILGRIRLGDIENLAFVSPIRVFYRVGCFLIGVLVTLVVVGMTLML